MLVIGVMSGTSLDGLDIAGCLFEYDGTWRFDLRQTVTIPYTDEWYRLLESLPRSSGSDLIKADIKYGHYIGKEIVRFIERYKIKPDLISSHGHTVFHQPDKGFTLQIGDGNSIAA
jgi:anhydro-N-acetylmuramic acid kinase